MDPKLLDLVERIATALELQSPKQGDQLGFIDRSGYKYVSVANENNGEHLWHTWDKINERQVPIHKTTLAGYLKGMEIKETVYKGKTNFKLNLIFDCGKQTVVLQSGIDTTFSRGAVLAIAQIPVLKLKEKILITVKPGNENTVLCSVTAGNDWIKSEWNSEPLEPLVAQINRNLDYVPRATDAGQADDRGDASQSPAGRSERVADWVAPAPGQREYIEAPTERASGLQPMSNSLPNYVQQAPVRTSVDNDITSVADRINVQINDITSVVAQINVQMQEKGITPDEARKLTLEKYGKRSRTLMSLGELQDFLQFLREEYPF